MSDNSCDRPPTKGEVILKIFKMSFAFLDKNKVEAVILFIGLGLGTAFYGLTLNNGLDKIIEIIK